MNRTRWTVVALVLVVALLGLWWWRSRAATTAPKYRTAELERGSIVSVVSATGTIRPVVQVEVGSQVSGTVDRISADFNSRVRAGQVILQLEQSSFRARVAQAEAAVARAEASVKDAERAFARARELFNQNYISQAELDAAAVAVELRKADLKQARAQLEAAEVDLEHTTIRAPIDGVVISRSVDLGQTVAASLQAPKLFVIANNLSHMQVETRIDEADIGRIRDGLPVTFTVDAFPDDEFPGRVTQVRLEPITEQNVVTYTTVIRTENPEGRLRPGMTANVTIRIEWRDDVLRVPNAALRFRPPGEGGSRGQRMAAGTGPGGASGGRSAAAGPAGAARAEGSAAGSPRAGGEADSGSLAAGRPQGAGGARAAGGEPPSERARAGSPREAQAATAAGERPRGMGASAMGAMSEEERAVWRERWQAMSPEERERSRDSLTTAWRAGGGRESSASEARSAAGGPAEGRGGGEGWRRGGGEGPADGDRGGAGAAGRSLRASSEPGSGAREAAPDYRPGGIYVLRAGKAERLMVLTGITDGTFTEVLSETLKPGDRVIVGLENAGRLGTGLQPPPGMGGPQFRGPGGGGRR